ncbi:MAG TPA: tyrosine-type recombinase/integrase [Pseudonocardiaceae bacterium]|nr:tyrosine-type recombinase/integrase [Pseudonocardiaceae bacterium]
MSPSAGKLRFRVYAQRWAASRNLTARTTERTTSILRNHLLPKWGEWPIGGIDHLSVQEWVTGLSKTLAPATVGKCFGTLRTILRSAMRARLIAVDPTEGVTAPSTYQARPLTATISREAFLGKLLPAAPLDHRAIVAIGGGAGLRWGEAAGLPWGAVDLTRRQLQVGQVAIETANEVTVRPYPKSRAGVRTIPIPDFLVRELGRHRQLTVGDATPVPGSLIFPTRNGTPLRRSNFRRQVWRPALVRAGLLGEVAAVGDTWRVSWVSQSGVRHHRTFATEREAIEHIVKHAEGGLRYHDLRHSYATWLVSDGVPVNVVQRVMGHEQASTTLNRYTHTPDDFGQRVRAAFEGPAPFSLPQTSQSTGAEESTR